MKEKIQACLLGAAIGDGMGQPFETMSRKRIAKLVPGGVTTFMDGMQMKIRENANLRAGQTTDDFQLSKMVGYSLIKHRGFNLEGMESAHIQALRSSTAGWGENTKLAIQAFLDYEETDAREGRMRGTPSISSGPMRGAANGVAMKTAPLGCFHMARDGEAFSQRQLWLECYALGVMTHTDPQAWDTAFAVAYLAAWALADPIETHMDAKDRLKRLIGAIPKQSSSTQAALEQGVRMIGNPDRITFEITPGWLANQSVVYSILMYLTYRDDFQAGVLRAVNDGIDCDTTASMVGALIGANSGLEVIPPEWQTFHPSYQEAFTLGSSLYETAKRCRP
ncbi:MAG TPA: ADP-ribosylglycohydrolase family protein [Verrucomicrobiae bacterium]|nr:ADP-ribosylglycohydrolase family protein [Verrucomicrobiae bacterium]